MKVNFLLRFVQVTPNGSKQFLFLLLTAQTTHISFIKRLDWLVTRMTWNESQLKFHLNQWPSTCLFNRAATGTFLKNHPPTLPTTLVLTKILSSFEIISMLMKQRLSFVSTKTNKENEGNCIGKNNVIHFQKQLVATRAVEPEKTTLRKILDACSWNRSPKFEFRFHSPDSKYCEPCPWLLSASF